MPTSDGARRVLLRRLGVILLASVGFLAAVAFARATTPIITDSDFAVTEVYTELATRGRLLLGPYSRFGWNHPGPLYFYLQAPFYAAGGHRAASLFAVAVAINLTAILTLLWVIARANGGALLVLVAAACVGFAWRAPMFLASPWTGHVPILAGLTFLVLCAAVMSGSTRLLPLAIVFGSFITQTHVGFVPMAGLMGGMAIVSLFVKADRRSLWRTFAVSAATALALWILPIGEALSNGGGNAATLVRFFVTKGASGHTLADACVAWSYGLAGLLRPDFGLPWGGHFAPAGQWWIVPYALAQVLLVGACAWRDSRVGRRFESALALSALAASGVGLWALTRIEGDILDHEIFWLAALGALNLAIIGAAAVRGAAAVWLPTWRVPAWTATAACAAIIALGLQLSVRQLRDMTGFELRRSDRPTIVASYTMIAGYLRQEGIRQPLIDIDGAAWSHAGGVVLRLLQDGTSFTMPDTALPMFTAAFKSRGDEDAVITITRERGHHDDLRARPGNVVVRDAHPFYIDAVRVLPSERPVVR